VQDFDLPSAECAEKARKALPEVPAPAAPPRRPLPPFRVVLHNDQQNEMRYVVKELVTIARLDIPSAVRIMMMAHHRGMAQVLITHKERAELYRSQFRRRRLHVTIEPASQ
jgi:ATP-dependent Clp protease adaptor protein ClpS